MQSRFLRLATLVLASSLALPVSNLTNLLAVHRLPDADALSFVALMGGSAAVAILVVIPVLAGATGADHAGASRGLVVALGVALLKLAAQHAYALCHPFHPII